MSNDWYEGYQSPYKGFNRLRRNHQKLLRDEYQSPYKGFNSNIAGLEIDLDHCLNPPIRGSIGKLRAAGYKDESFCLNPPIRGSIEMTREVEFLFRERASINPPIRGSIVDEKNKHYYGIRINPPIRGSIDSTNKD